MDWEQRRILEMAGLLRRLTRDHLLTEGEDEVGGDDAVGDDLFGDDARLPLRLPMDAHARPNRQPRRLFRAVQKRGVRWQR